MPTPKEWKNNEAGGTPLSAAALIDVEERLQRGTNVKDYGAKGDGITVDSTAIQEALDAAGEAGGGAVYVPAGTYLIGTTIVVDSGVHLSGAGRTASILKLKDAANTDVLTTARYGVGGETGGAEEFSVRDIEIDGNTAKNSVGGISIDGLAYRLDSLYIHDLPGGIDSEMSRTGLQKNMEAATNNLRVMDCGGPFTWEGPNDSIHTNLIVRSNGIGACIYASASSNWVNCHVYGNSDLGIIASSGNFVNCQSEGAKEAKVQFVGDGILWVGGRVFSAGGGDGKIGFQFGDGVEATANSTQIHGVEVANCDNGSFKFSTAAAGSRINAFVWGSEAKPAVTGTPSEEDIDWDIMVREPLTWPDALHRIGKVVKFWLKDGAMDTSGIVRIREQAAPSGSANSGKIYVDDKAGKTRLMVIFGSGVAQQIAIEP